ncbi:two-component system C4-dicarboxylate transport sensor histidine kinase DctB [Ancylobacter sp. 3268]|uniref:sensor histidine kinase n=1 Tax=Ancylobacter sp. 3268 TaxID=2817752 RepID=UPI0028631B0D|nr:ATP-binding protein [Ancylobacter sp. 3268]MDR6953621.1 two-component system C4-dicarboxylate transport sensor histidine kinase DctB [Ancylobacter sp. 3268]
MRLLRHLGSPGRIKRWRRCAWRAAPLLAAALLLVGLDQSARYGAQRWVLVQLRADAQAAAELRAAVLRSEIEKQRSLPVVLAQDPDVRAALSERAPAVLRALDAKFETLAGGTRAGVIYLLDAKGITLAASNFRAPTSFVGSDYSFRPYFRQAMADGAAEHFAFGTVSRRPGLYLTRRIDGAEGPLGVIVVKAEFSEVEADWRRLAGPTFVTDTRHIVLVTSVPGWQFRATAQITDEERVRIRASLQFGDASLDPLPITAEGDDRVRVKMPEGGAERVFVEAAAPVPSTGWTLHVLEPMAGTANIAIAAARVLALLGGALLVVALLFAWSRRRRALQKRRREERARRELERRVEARTRELSTANDRLREEMDQRQHAQSAMQGLQDELVQASKLAVLGQIAASVAHEVNQPVAAIRTFAESGGLLLARGDMSSVGGNLATIVGLTERIGAITGELRAFARKTPGHIGPVSLREAVEGAMLLLGHRLREQDVALEIDLGPGDIVVAAERVRLEQVLVNLLQNALEALTGRAGGRIRVEARAEGDSAVITLTDNGPGLPDSVLQALFMPFTTTKPAGLGLGLVISHDIVAEFGGSLAAANRDGAVFTLMLPRVP